MIGTLRYVQFGIGVFPVALPLSRISRSSLIPNFASVVASADDAETLLSRAPRNILLNLTVPPSHGQPPISRTFQTFSNLSIRGGSGRRVTVHPLIVFLTSGVRLYLPKNDRGASWSLIFLFA